MYYGKALEFRGLIGDFPVDESDATVRLTDIPLSETSDAMRSTGEQ
jgi:hypothetical protein